jgi:hypothetical protein
MSGRFILRTPLLKLEQLPIIEEIISVFSNAILREALYIASPDLYNELLKIEKNEIKNKTEISKIKKSLFKYYTRLCTRATPFGMFAGICVGQFENSTLIKFKDELVTNTRLDLGLLFNLYFEVSKIPQVFNNLLYSPNNTMYKVKNKWRYIEFKIHDNKRFHELVTIDDNEILSFIVESLNKTPHSIDEICEIIINFGFEKSEAKEYTESLIGNQILVSQIFPSVTGDNYEKKFFNLLAKIYPEKFKGIGLRLEKVLNNKNVNAINKVKSVKQILSSFSILTEETDLIQVDLLKKTNYCILDRNIKKRIEDCTLILANLNPEFNDYYRILNFKKKFYDRYEEALIPLSLVLDADIGIDYNAKNIKSNDGNSFDRGADMDFKLKLYRESLLKQSLSIEIFEDDIKPYIHMKNRKIPDSLSFFGSFLLEESQTTIIYQYAGGPSALNLLGRFGYLSNELSSLCEEIASSETLNNKDAILAEIAHLPMLRLGNVIYRPHYREYEIPLLAYSDLPLAKQNTIK